LRFGKSEMTNFVARPTEKFETDRVRWLRQRLRLGAKRLAYALRRSRRD
jgi:hypothetical protein